jgi:hypothetical protein
MTDSMVERVARALCASTGSSELVVAHSWRAFEAHARAALAAMREPTDEMLHAGFLADEDDRMNGGEGIEPLKSAWQAMIDEALK